MSDEGRIKRSAKKPAWMNDEMLIDPAEVEAEVKVPRPPVRKPHAGPELTQRVMAAAHHEVMMQRPCRPSGRMCSNPQCKNPYDSPQWRRGPLGPGTLCNACGTRYARLQAKMNGDKKSKMRPQERAEWEAFEQQRVNPQVPQHQTWRTHMQHFVQREQQQQQYYLQEQDEYAGYEDSDYGYDERSYGSQQQAGHIRQQQHYGDGEDIADPEATEDGQLLCQEGLSDSPDIASRAAMAAAAAAAAAAAGSRPSSRTVWRGGRQHMPAAEAATDSQEDEAGAYSCQDAPAGADGGAGGSPAGPSFLHLLAVGEAMIKTEGVAPQDRRAAWAEVVERRLGPEPEKPPARAAAAGDALQGVKRSRFALEAEEQQGGRPAPSAEPTALQRALERFGQQPVTKRAKPGPAGESVVATDRFERLLAEAEECIRARSVSPCMLKGMPGPGSSPTCNMPAPRPITPLQLGVNAMDAAHARAAMPRSLLGAEMAAPQQDLQQGMAAFMLPGAAMSRRAPPAAAAASSEGHQGGGRGRHASLAQALAAAAAAEADSPVDDDADGGAAGQQCSPGSDGGSALGRSSYLGDPSAYARPVHAAAAGAGGGAFDAAAAAAAVAAGGGFPPSEQHAFDQQAGEHAPPHPEHGGLQVLHAHSGPMGPSSEPSPVSKLLMADEVLSPTTMLMPSKLRKQGRSGSHPHGPAAAAMGAAAAAAGGGGRVGGSSHVQRKELAYLAAAGAGRPATLGGHAAHAAAHMGQLLTMQQQQQLVVGQPGLHMQPMLMQQAQSQQQQPGQGSLPSAAQLQQAGHRPVVLACQLVLQQQADPTSLQPLFDTPGSCGNPLQGKQQGSLPGPSASAALVGSALQLAQQAGGGSTQNHLDQLKAVTESAVAAAATASAVAAATALLWQQLQQQEQARERQRGQKPQEQQEHPAPGGEVQPEQDNQAAEQADAVASGGGAADAVGDAGAGGGADAGGAGGDGAARASPAAGSAGVASHDAASISRSSSSSTSAAGLSAAPGDSHSVDKQPTVQADGPDQQPAQAPALAVPCADHTAAASAGAEGVVLQSTGLASTCAPTGSSGGDDDAGVAAADADAAAAGAGAAIDAPQPATAGPHDMGGDAADQIVGEHEQGMAATGEGGQP